MILQVKQGDKAFEGLPDNPTPAQISAARVTMGLTQAELAAILHVNPKIPSRWENGTKPQAATLVLLGRLYDDWLHRPRLFAQAKREALG